MDSPSNWSKYGEWRHPFQYWGNLLLFYFNNNNEELLDKNPRVTKILSKTIWYKFENEEKEYSIKKETLKEPPPIDPNALPSLGILLTIHFVKIPIKESFINMEVYSEIEDETLVEEILERIYSKNPHWKMDILNEEQLRDNIYDVLCNHFETVHFIEFTNK